MDWDDLVVHSSDLEDWLSLEQPTGDERANWWLGWVLVSVGKVQSVVGTGDIPDATTLDRVVRVLNVATGEGAVTSADRAIRLANLAGLIARAGGSVRFPPDLQPDVAIRECLELLPQNIADVELAASRWKSLPIDEARVLRRMKNLVGPMMRLAPYLEDRDLADRVARWRDIYPYLP